jgi:hypothetical protein
MANIKNCYIKSELIHKYCTQQHKWINYFLILKNDLCHHYELQTIYHYIYKENVEKINIIINENAKMLFLF